MKRRFLALLLSAALVAVGLVISASPVAGSFPGTNGRITFMRFDDDGRSQVWAANPDMTHQVQLTSGTDDGWFPTWSPDGTRIAFSSYRTDLDPDDGVEVMDVFTMRADGTDVRQLTDSQGFNGKPSWSPDGQWIVFDADRGNAPAAQGIYRIRSDGSGTPIRVTVLPVGSNWQELARYSPDGEWIVFNEYRGGTELSNRREGWVVAEQSALFLVHPDGTGLRQVTGWGLHAGDADWSPDGKRLVFSAQPFHQGNLGEVMTVDASGSNLVNVSNCHGLTGTWRNDSVWYEECFNASWSPDGSKIVFLEARYRDGQFTWKLQTISPKGTARATISTFGFEHQPDWGSAPLLP